MKRPSYATYMADHESVALTDNASTVPDRPRIRSRANKPLSDGLQRRFSSIHRVTFYWTYVCALSHTCLRVLRDVTHILQAGCVCPIKDKRANALRNSFATIFLRQANCTRNVTLNASFCTFARWFYDYYREYHFPLGLFSDLSAICHRMNSV